MKYRKMGKKIDWEVSALGFGAMRLPVAAIEVNGQTQFKINEKEAVEMMRYAFDHGVNYVDSGYNYHQGESEVIVGKALENGYREKVHVVTKFPVNFVRAEEFDQVLSTQLKRLQTDYLDLYHLHGLNRRAFDIVKKYNLMKKMEEAQASGLIKHIGFSFHDSIDVFKEIIDFYDWDAVQIQYNYLDIEYQATQKGLKYAADKGIAMIVMEPLQGGKLTIPDKKLEGKPQIKEVLDKAITKRKMADWGLQFVWNHPEVAVVLSGMSNLQHVTENVESANNSGIDTLTPDDLNIIVELRNAFKSFDIVPCTNCEYCLPCPSSVNIPGNFRALNNLAYWGDRSIQRIRFQYDRMAKTEAQLKNNPGGGSALLCTKCEECIEKCPQNINIPVELEKVKAVFEEGKSLADIKDM